MDEREERNKHSNGVIGYNNHILGQKGGKSNKTTFSARIYEYLRDDKKRVINPVKTEPTAI